MSLPERLHHQLRSLSPDQQIAVATHIRDAAISHEMWMDDRKADRSVPIAASPLFVDPAIRGYLHHATWQMRRALQRLPAVVAEDEAAAALLRLGDAEREWLEQYRTEAAGWDSRYCRLDALFRNGDAARPAELKFIEPNVVGLGGLCYANDTVDILEECTLAPLVEQEPDLVAEPADDPRELLYRELLDFSEANGFGLDPTVALIGSRSGYETDGEDRRLVAWLNERGLDTLFADPRELCLTDDGSIVADERRIDVCYRMTELGDLVEIEQKGEPLDALRAAFDRGAVTPTVGGDLEHKSVFELFTSERFADHFTPAQRRVFERHVLWTRLLDERTTTGPTGERIDLAAYARDHRESLVLKPNRSYGGSGVLIGKHTGTREWERAVDDALAAPDDFVIQRLAPLVREELPVPTADGQGIETRSVYTVIGAFPSRYGLGLLGRYADEPVVNVTRSGGVLPVMVDFT